MDNIEIKLLRTFLVLLSERNVSSTAEQLGVTQPAVSHALTRLRTLFDDPLLLRSRSGMVPSSRAAEFAEGVQSLLATYDGLLQLARPFDPSASSQTFRISAPEFPERLLLPDMVRLARQEAPNIRIEMFPPPREKAIEMLESGRLDLRIAWLEHPPQSLRSTQLFQDRIVCVADPQHASVRGRISVKQFTELPHARPYGAGRTVSGRVVDEAVERHGGRLNLAFQVQNYLSIPPMLQGTDLIATTPLRLALSMRQYHPLQILEVPLRLPRIRYAAYWHERSHKDPAHKWLRELVVQAARRLAPYQATIDQVPD
jgi:DNA-binding transcriptional LysR family regulator